VVLITCYQHFTRFSLFVIKMNKFKHWLFVLYIVACKHDLPQYAVVRAVNASTLVRGEPCSVIRDCVAMVVQIHDCAVIMAYNNNNNGRCPLTAARRDELKTIVRR